MCRSPKTRTAAAEAGYRGRLYQTQPTGLISDQDSDFFLLVGSRVDPIKKCSFGGVALSCIISEIKRDFHTPFHSTPPLRGSRRNIAIPFGVKKLG